MSRSLSAGALLFLAPAAAFATVLADWDLPELLARADRVAIGTIGEKRTVLVEQAPMTETAVRVEETLFGAPVRALSISQLGGVIGGKRTWVDGDAELVRGAKMVLFTYEHRDGRTYLVGMSLGAFLISGDVLSQPASTSTPTRTRSLAKLRALIGARR